MTWLARPRFHLRRPSAECIGSVCKLPLSPIFLLNFPTFLLGESEWVSVEDGWMDGWMVGS